MDEEEFTTTTRRALRKTNQEFISIRHRIRRARRVVVVSSLPFPSLFVNSPPVAPAAVRAGQFLLISETIHHDDTTTLRKTKPESIISFHRIRRAVVSLWL